MMIIKGLDKSGVKNDEYVATIGEARNLAARWIAEGFTCVRLTDDLGYVLERYPLVAKRGRR